MTWQRQTIVTTRTGILEGVGPLFLDCPVWDARLANSLRSDAYQCPLWVKSRHSALRKRTPLFDDLLGIT